MNTDFCLEFYVQFWWKPINKQFPLEWRIKYNVKTIDWKIISRYQKHFYLLIEERAHIVAGCTTK